MYTSDGKIRIGDFMINNKKVYKSILSILVSCSVAAPIVCLPIGIHKGTNPSLIVRRAYAATFPEEDEEEVFEGEDFSDVEADEFIMSGGTIQSTYLDGYSQDDSSSIYSDISPYVVYQEYDEAGLKVELLDPMFFAPDETTYYIQAPDSILKEKPDMDSMTLQSLSYGVGVTRIAYGDSWSKIRTQDGAEGYVLTDTLSYEMVWVDISREVWVDADSLSLRAEPSTESELIATLPNDTHLHCTGISDKWFKVVTDNGTEGYVYISYTDQTPPTPTPTPRPANTGNGSGGSGSSSSSGGTNYNNVHGQTWVNTGNNGQTIANIAVSMVGTPYVWGASSSSAVDCSGLVVYCYAQLGVPLPHYSVSLCSVGEPVSRENVQPGDIVCWTRNGSYCHHVGIYVGGGQCVDARGAAWGTVYGSIDRQSIIAIRRIYT